MHSSFNPIQKLILLFQLKIIRINYHWLIFLFWFLIIGNASSAKQKHLDLRSDPYLKFSRGFPFSKNYLLFNSEIRPLDRKFAPNYSITYNWFYEPFPDFFGDFNGRKKWMLSFGTYEVFFQYSAYKEKFRFVSSIGFNSYVTRSTYLYEDTTIVDPALAGAALSGILCVSIKLHRKFSAFVSGESLWRRDCIQFKGERINKNIYWDRQYLIGLTYWFGK